VTTFVIKWLGGTALCLALLLQLTSCDVLFGKKDDATIDEIFTEGSIDPALFPNQVGYVPVQPFWNYFNQPVDVFVGYDEMIYVVDADGLKILDQKGTLQRTVFIDGATDVTQDRRLHTYVTARVNRVVSGVMYNLPAVFHLSNTSVADGPLFIDTIVHPFSDVSRNNTVFRGAADEAVRFTGLATLADNTLYVSRTGPTNDPASLSRPDNAVLFFDESGNNIGFTFGASATVSNLKSVLQPEAIASFAAPPQALSGVSASRDLLVAQGSPAAEFKVLWLKETFDPDAGSVFGENAALAQADLTKADRFLYMPNRFSLPADVYAATDGTGYIFVVDSEKDSLYQFTRLGQEGVNPPANSGITKQIIASFGGLGSGPFNFSAPSGVCYFKKTVYVADKNNNRICRYKLSTDVE